MASTKPYRIKTISEYHQVMGLPRPDHPLISVINFESLKQLPYHDSTSLVFDFYSISLKRNFKGKMKYGQQEYDFDEGIMFFISPGQVFGIELEQGCRIKTYGLAIAHPSRFFMEQPAGQNNKAI